MQEAIDPIGAWRDHRVQRGTSRWHDYLDRTGGYPFEVGTPEVFLDLCLERGFAFDKLNTYGGGGIATKSHYGPDNDAYRASFGFGVT